MTDPNRYLNAEESRQVREFAEQYRGDDQPSDADQVIDDLDRILLKNEPINTIELVNSLLTTRALEAQKKAEHSSVPTRVLQSMAADDAMADLDDCLWQNVREQSPLSEDGGWAHLDKTAAELVEGQKVVKGQREAAARERQATARRFNGFAYRTVSEAQFYRGRKG
jgi:hypothetical protein